MFPLFFARVAELADAQDLKSCGGNIVPVQVRSRALETPRIRGVFLLPIVPTFLPEWRNRQTHRPLFVLRFAANSCASLKSCGDDIVYVQVRSRALKSILIKSRCFFYVFFTLLFPLFCPSGGIGRRTDPYSFSASLRTLALRLNPAVATSYPRGFCKAKPRCQVQVRSRALKAPRIRGVFLLPIVPTFLPERRNWQTHRPLFVLRFAANSCASLKSCGGNIVP